MELLTADYLMSECDYSFGAITVGNIKPANQFNEEFIKKCEDFQKDKKIMTLFIDNIRLYQRIDRSSMYNNMEMEPTNNWQNHKDSKNKMIDLYSGEDLLKLCSKIPELNFIIFTGYEDTNIDDDIFNKIPENVLGVYVASCSESINEKVHPIPFGLPIGGNNDTRYDTLRNIISSPDVEANSLVYINHSVGSNPYREKVNEYFSDKTWCTIKKPVSIATHDYKSYLNEIKSHKFTISVDGNAINCDCYRVWETLYMNRVPIVKRSKNFEILFKDYPVLLVDDFCEITKEFLLENDHLYQEALNFDVSKLDMSRIYKEIVSQYDYYEIVEWIKNYAKPNNFNLVVGISGGIDSALVSTLCAKTGLETYVISMPIHQKSNQLERAHEHINWLKKNFKNVQDFEFDLTKTFDTFSDNFIPVKCDKCGHPLFGTFLSLANSRSRLRMMSLYQIASNVNGIVVGTGNKVEDFGVGFFTKYGDGGVDISPIADLTKTEVRKMSKTLGVIDDIIVAKPTDGLWDDDRSDEDQIGATYEELEWVMDYLDNNEEIDYDIISKRQSEVILIYKKFNNANKHKMVSIPVFKNKIK